MAQLYDANGNPVFTDVVSQGVALAALNAAVSLQLRGQATACFQITVIGSQTLSFEGSVDGANFFALNAMPLTGGAAVTTTTTTGQWTVNCAGLFIVRLRVSTQTSGSATVSGIASQGGDVDAAVDSTGALRADVVSIAGTALGTPTAFGTTPGAVVAESANASVFIGTTAAVAAAAGIQKVGVSGATGATLDAVTTAATAPANGLAVLVENVTTAPSLTTGQSVMAQSDYQGSLFVKPYRRGQTVSQATTISATGATTILAAQAAGIFADITTLIISVTPQATTASSFTATISDGTNSYVIDLIAQVTTANGTTPPVVLQFDPPLKATAAATAWTINISATNTIHVTVVAALQKAS